MRGLGEYASFGAPALSSTFLLTLNPQLMSCSAELTFYNGIHGTVYISALGDFIVVPRLHLWRLSAKHNQM